MLNSLEFKKIIQTMARFVKACDNCKCEKCDGYGWLKLNIIPGQARQTSYNYNEYKHGLNVNVSNGQYYPTTTITAHTRNYTEYDQTKINFEDCYHCYGGRTKKSRRELGRRCEKCEEGLKPVQAIVSGVFGVLFGVVCSLVEFPFFVPTILSTIGFYAFSRWDYNKYQDDLQRMAMES